MYCKECKENLKVSATIVGLSYCCNCERFYYESSSADNSLTFEKVLKELVILSERDTIIQNYKCVHIISDILKLGLNVHKAYMQIVTTRQNLCQDLKDAVAAANNNNNDAMKNLVLSISRESSINNRLIEYILDVSAYALGLFNYVEPYDEINDSTFKLEYFKSSRNYIKKGERTKIKWKITGDAIVVVELSNGDNTVIVEKSGTLEISSETDVSYILSISSEYYHEEYELNIKIIKRPFYTTWWFWSVIGIFISFAALEIFSSYYTSIQKAEVLTETSIDIDKIIPGLYSVKYFVDNQDNGVNLNAEIIHDLTTGAYQLVIVSKFDPELHEFYVLQNKELSSVTLGVGTVLYKEKIDRTTIIFKKGDIRWEFKK